MRAEVSEVSVRGLVFTGISVMVSIIGIISTSNKQGINHLLPPPLLSLQTNLNKNYNSSSTSSLSSLSWSQQTHLLG